MSLNYCLGVAFIPQRYVSFRFSQGFSSSKANTSSCSGNDGRFSFEREKPKNRVWLRSTES